MSSKLRRFFSFKRTPAPVKEDRREQSSQKKYVKIEEYNEMKQNLQELLEDERHNSLRNHDRFVDLYSKMVESLEKLEVEKQNLEVRTTIEKNSLKEQIAQKTAMIKNLNRVLASRDLTIRLMKVEFEQTMEAETGTGGWLRKFFDKDEIALMKAAVESLPLLDTSSTEDSSAPTCGICDEEFAETEERTPRILDCGHTMCQDCITKSLYANGTLQCPWDRFETNNPSFRPLPKNFALVDVIRNLAAKIEKEAEKDDVDVCASDPHPLDNFGCYTSSTVLPTFDRNTFKILPARRQSHLWN